MTESEVRRSDAENAALVREIEKTIPAMDIGNATRFLHEARRVFDDHGVVFFLRQGTALGAVRDGALIPWDDDLDLGSIIALHGFDEALIDPVVEVFRSIDCYVEVHPEGLYTSVKIMKYRIRIDWQCYRVVKGTIAHYPGVPFPVRLFEQLDEARIDGVTTSCRPRPTSTSSSSTAPAGGRRSKSDTRRTSSTTCRPARCPGVLAGCAGSR